MFLFTLIFFPFSSLFYLLGYFVLFVMRWQSSTTIFQNSAPVTNSQHSDTPHLSQGIELFQIISQAIPWPFFSNTVPLCSAFHLTQDVYLFFLPFSPLCKFTFPSHTSPVCRQYPSGYCTGLTSLLYLQKQLPISRS